MFSQSYVAVIFLSDACVEHAHAVAASISLSKSATPTTQNPTPTVTDEGFWFPLVGLSDDISKPWGANISTLHAGSYNLNFTPYAITVNDGDSVSPAAASTTDSPVNFEMQHSDGGSSNADQILIVAPTGDHTLSLGLNSSLGVTSPGKDDLASSTVPFGLNLGRNGTWNGSITLNGYYDAARINSTSWISVGPYPRINGNTTVLESGKQTVEIFLRGRNPSISSRARNATFDFNNDAIILPNGFDCGDNIAINIISDTSDTLVNYDLAVPGYLMDAEGRCRAHKHSDDDLADITLGRPFFQATYAYVNETGALFLAQANNYDLPIDAKRFHASETLTPPAGPPPAKHSSASGSYPLMETSTLLVILLVSLASNL
ncbi:uncharacterized protein BDZ99DRAFT_539866 [Mytilinidion resinicola]|uniref:Acid protease n=1 Tax=Mytilinidion resinicola TaxID=574789 RepID=A0A6A6YA18_9PEZI|nr:uncharacterized protein BDZ99DRAFT_539866 [Mytilinidion resinicola]KAF2805469.1 hypothetical protein BDZ99DRAFT_539866 [Mytilinidion resinicola]